MNLLIDPWIPVKSKTCLEQITLQTLLTSKTHYSLSLPRDDMELGALQLLISLVQVIATPENAEQSRKRALFPLTKEDYLEIVKLWLEKFDLLHNEHPFMQQINSQAKATTPIQKLFMGLPAGNNHAFFNEVGEINQICGGCAAIALFNLASNAPGFSGKHKAGLRGGGKINTLIAGHDLRETIWVNILNNKSIEDLLPEAKNNELCWIDPIKPKEKISADSIGLNRGLFWQPLRLKLEFQEHSGECEHCGHKNEQMYTGFICEADFKFEVLGRWPHPHSPRQWNIKKGEKDKEHYLSLNQLVPGWTQLNQFILNQSSEEQGSLRAVIVSQFENVFLDQVYDKLIIHVSGYANNQAAILERRHELFSMPEQWQENKKWIQQAIIMALEIKHILRGKLYYFAPYCWLLGFAALIWTYFL